MPLPTRIVTAGLFLLLGIQTPRAIGQADANAAVDEVSVNEAAGRAVVAVVNGAILIGTVENPIEPGTIPPVPAMITSDRAGVILGADEWTSPSLQKDLARLDVELPTIRPTGAADAPHLGAAGVQNGEASDIEAIGKPLRDRIAAVAGSIHSNLNWPSNDPVVELVIADYLSGYGAEVWQVTYGLEQEQQHGDFWVTNVAHPVYSQIWPPEKGQPHTLMEFDYPPENAPPSLLELLRRKDPRLEALVRSDAKMADTAGRLLSGESPKISAGDATQFLRAALDAIKPANARESMAMIKEDTGFQWVLAPPAEPKKAITGGAAERPADAPTLVHAP